MPERSLASRTLRRRAGVLKISGIVDFLITRDGDEDRGAHIAPALAGTVRRAANVWLQGTLTRDG